MAFKKIHQRKGPNLNLFDTKFQTLQNSESGEQFEVVILDSNDAVNVIPVDTDKQILVIQQYRFGIQDYTLEIPGGFVEKNEDPLFAVKRELLEETGYAAEEWMYLGKFPLNPVFQSAYIHHYIALGAKEVAEPNPDAEEEIILKKLHKDLVWQKLKDGEFQHTHTVSAFMLAFDLLFKI